MPTYTYTDLHLTDWPKPCCCPINFQFLKVLKMCTEITFVKYECKV